MSSAAGPFKFVVTTQQAPNQDSAVTSANRAHTAKAIHRQRKARHKFEPARKQRRRAFPLTPQSSSDEICSDVPHSPMALALQPKFKGNSDPFAATAVPMTPQYNELISFMRDTVYPKLGFNRFMQHFASDISLDFTFRSSAICMTSLPANQHWTFIKSMLGAPPSALAFLSTAATYLATMEPEYRVKALEMRLESSSHLRGLLSSSDMDQQLLKATLFWLYNSEARAQNFKAATAISKMLVPLIKKGIDSGGDSPLLLMEYRFLEDDVAMYNLSRVAFDMDSWFPGMFEGLWQSAERLMPPSPFTAKDIHPVVKQPLRQHFHNMRYLYYLWDNPIQANTAADQQLIFRWLTTRYSWLSGCLLNTYAGLMDTDSRDDTRHVQSLLALALLSHTRVVGSSSLIGSVDYRGAVQPAVQMIKMLILSLTKRALENREIADVLLWALCLGSSWEIMSPRSSGDPWFTTHLKAHTQAHGIRSWETCRFVLKSLFLVETDVADCSALIGDWTNT
jgi:hypothetical protein